MPESEIVSGLKGVLSNHWLRELDGISGYLCGVRLSGRTYTGAVAALVKDVENSGVTVRIYYHSGSDFHAMAIVGDRVKMMLDRFPENVRGRFKIDKSNPIAIKYTLPHSDRRCFNWIKLRRRSIKGNKNSTAVEFC